MPNWESDDIKQWLEKAKEEQQFFCNALGDRHYDAYDADEVKYLDLKIGNAFYGPPKQVDENQNEVELSNYEWDQQKHVEKVRDLILTKTGSSNIRVAFIFLSLKQHSNHSQMPVVRLLDLDDKVFFIDHQVRLYEGWRNFLSENLFPKCIYCYPKSGVYEVDQDGDVLLSTDTSPSCSPQKELVNAADTISNIAMLGSVGMTIGALLFPTAAILGTAAVWSGVGSGAYSVARNASKLSDRKEHKQSVNPLTDAEARACWFACVGGALGMGSMGLLKYTSHLARNGEVARKAVRVAYSCMEGGNLTVNGLGIISQAYELCSKKDKVSIGDVVSLSTSILFFTHACVNLKSASTIIKDVQASVLADAEASLSRKQKANFRKLVENTTVGETQMHGNAKVIKSLKRINNLEDFVRNTANIQNRAGGNHEIKLTDKGLISIYDQLEIHPNKMVTIGRQSRKKIMDCTQKLKNNPDYAPQFVIDVKDICKRERINFQIMRQETVSKMCSSLGVKDLGDYKINGKKIFKDLQPHEIDRIGSVMKNSGQDFNEQMMEISKEFAAKMEFENKRDFCIAVEFTNQFVLDEMGELTSGPVDQRRREVLTQLRTPESGLMNKMLKRFTEIKNEVSKLNAGASAPFASNNQATYHFYKHKNIAGQEITPSDYFKMIEDNFKNVDLPRDSTLSQNGNKVYITITDPSTGLKQVVIKPVASCRDGTVYTATFFYDERIHKKC